MRVLLVEDDRELSQRLKSVLTEAGGVVDCVFDGDEALYYGQNTPYDCIVLDLGLPILSGLQVLKAWRDGGLTTPVLILTARNSWTERVEGLNLGADDYLGKPFQAAEVVARLRALVRRSAGQASSALRVGDLVLDPGAGSAQYNGTTVDLTARELRILSFLMQRAGRIVPQSELIDHTYAWSETRESNTIEVYIARLRRKFGKDVIRTVRGLGYRMG
jgi:two-component system, OmpR family, response regulator